MITFEALPAKHGDCLLLRYKDDGGKDRLWVVDGGPSGVYKAALKPRLKEIRQARGGSEPLAVDLLMVSHIDDDHINGVEQMLRDVVDNTPSPFSISQCWFNSFASLAGPLPAAIGTPAALASTAQAILSGHALAQDTAAVLSSVSQGNNITASLVTKHIPMNAANGPLFTAPASFDYCGVTVTALGPLKGRLEKLQTEWAQAAAMPAALAQVLDNSIPNLSSIAVLVERGGKSILLTGDARGDDLLEGWTQRPGGSASPRPVDIFKLPHHGSSHNTTKELLKTFPAGHYVISANGRYDNPDSETLEMLVETQGDRNYTIHITCDIHKFNGATDQGPDSRVVDLLKNLQQGRNFQFAIGKPVIIDL